MRRAAGLLVTALAVGMLAACSPAPRSLDGVDVVVYQPRTDIALGRLAIQVVNDSETPLEVVGVVLESTGFSAPVAWDGDSTMLAPGRAIDLRAPLPVFVCASDAMATVELAYRDGGSTRTTALVPDDPYDLLERLRTEQCLGERIAEIVAIVPREVRVDDPAGPAVLVIDLTPTGAPGTVVLDAVDGTPLLQPAVDGIAVLDVRELGIELSADGPRTLELPLVPNRCDAHALADDKVGTIIPFLVTVDDAVRVRWPMPTPPDLAGALTGYYAAHCGLAAP